MKTGCHLHALSIMVWKCTLKVGHVETAHSLAHAQQVLREQDFPSPLKR